MHLPLQTLLIWFQLGELWLGIRFPILVFWICPNILLHGFNHNIVYVTWSEDNPIFASDLLVSAPDGSISRLLLCNSLSEVVIIHWYWRLYGSLTFVHVSYGVEKLKK